MDMKQRILAKANEGKNITGLPEPEKRKDLRKAAGLTQSQAAQVMSEQSGSRITRSAVANWETGRNAPSAEQLAVYKEFLNACTELENEQAEITAS
jgi:DNA-binding transcriptional regulator YiaG